MLNKAELDALWGGLEREAFRLETLDNYAVPHEADVVRRYVTGEAYTETDFARGWADTVAAMTARGVTYHRVHIVHSPLSEYLRYECEWGYTRYAQRGERAYILDTAEVARPPEVPDYDFWLLDDTHAIRMLYEKDGAFLGAELLPASVLDEHRRARDAAIAAATPFEAWWAGHPEAHRENWLGVA
jgi:hypothetical protein